MEEFAYLDSLARFDMTKYNVTGNLEDFVLAPLEEGTEAEVQVRRPEDAPNYVETFRYRGFEVPIFYDDPGQQYYCVFSDGSEVSFGSFNPEYKSDLEYIIDHQLDTIRVFDDPYWGARLEWFDNGDFRDIRLVYRMRTLRVFVTAGNFELTYQLLDTITTESKKILDLVMGRTTE